MLQIRLDVVRPSGSMSPFPSFVTKTVSHRPLRRPLNLRSPHMSHHLISCGLIILMVFVTGIVSLAPGLFFLAILHLPPTYFLNIFLSRAAIMFFERLFMSRMKM